MKINKNFLITAIICLVITCLTGCTGFTTLEPPQNVNATNIECHNDKITVSWDSVEGADYYQIFRSSESYSSNSKHKLSVDSVSSVNPSNSYLTPPKDKLDSECGYKIAVEKNILNPTFEDTYIKQGVKYYYKIKALNKLFVESALSKATGGAAGTFPDFPDNAFATDGIYTDNILISWEKVDAAKLYRVYKSETLDGEYKQAGNDISADSTYTTPPGPVNLHAEFFSDVDLAKEKFVSGSMKCNIRIILGNYVNILAEFVGKTWGVYYSRDEVIDEINNKARQYTGNNDLTICFPVDTEDNKKLVKIISNSGKISIINEDKTLTFSAIDRFLKEGVTNWNGPPVISDLINGKIEVSPKPIPMPQPPEGDYGYIDNDIQTGKKYFYMVKVIDENDEESHFSPVNNGYAASAAAPSAPAGININTETTGQAIITWNAVSDADKYRVYRSDSSEGLYEKISTDINSNTLEFTDSTIKGDNVYYYRVTAINNDGLESMFSISGEGQGKLTPVQFCSKMYETYKYMKAKCDYLEPNPLGSVNFNIPGDIGGNLHWTIDVHGTTGTAKYNFTDYNDFGLVWNGETHADSGMAGNGTVYGTINYTGNSEAQVRFFVEFRNRQDCGGYFLVSYPAGEPEIRIEFTEINN